MDAMDRKILKVLQTDARASLQQIGQTVGLSASPCWERIKKMELAGVIEGYTVRLNPQALDLNDTVLVQLTLDSHTDNTLEKFGEVLATIPEVIEAYLVSGDYDYLLKVAARSSADYEHLRDKLMKRPGVKRTKSSFMHSASTRTSVGNRLASTEANLRAPNSCGNRHASAKVNVSPRSSFNARNAVVSVPGTAIFLPRKSPRPIGCRVTTIGP